VVTAGQLKLQDGARVVIDNATEGEGSPMALTRAR
jgi:hypothetical protein